MRETIGGGASATVLDFIYDAQERPFALNYSTNGTSFTTYYYILNLQGDVVKMVDSSGTEVAVYTYDAWGKVLSAEKTMAAINPLRYRGYYCDTETGFYYLQSRYYDPELHRFINADSLASTGQGFAGTNMFAYCLNNPVQYADFEGRDVVFTIIEGEASFTVDGKCIVTVEYMLKYTVATNSPDRYLFGASGISYETTSTSKTSGITQVATVGVDVQEGITAEVVAIVDEYETKYGSVSCGLSIHGSVIYTGEIDHGAGFSTEYNYTISTVDGSDPREALAAFENFGTLWEEGRSRFSPSINYNRAITIGTSVMACIALGACVCFGSRHMNKAT